MNIFNISFLVTALAFPVLASAASESEDYMRELISGTAIGPGWQIGKPVDIKSS